MQLDPYNDAVRAYFGNPVHAGDPDSTYLDTRTSEVDDPGGSVWIRLSAGVVDGKIAEMRFRAYGCPHVIAAAELLCREAEGESIEVLSAFDWDRMRTKLDVPVQKTGRLLMLEDAARALL